MRQRDEAAATARWNAALTVHYGALFRRRFALGVRAFFLFAAVFWWMRQSLLFVDPQPQEPETMSDPASTSLAGERAAHGTALLVIDMISCWDFPDADALLPFAADAAPRIAALKHRCVAAGVPTIYCNDNRGRWRSDFRSLVEAASTCGGPGAEIVRTLAPAPDDYFVLKPMHSAFFATPLELLLKHLGARRILLTGVSSDQCIMSSAAEAKMRDLEVLVPCDAVASQSVARNHTALRQFRDTHNIQTPSVDHLVLTRAGEASDSAMRSARSR